MQRSAHRRMRWLVTTSPRPPERCTRRADMQRAASERATCCTMCCTLHASCRPLDAVRRNVTGSCGSPPTRQQKAKASLRCIPTAMRCRAPTRRRRCVEKRQNALQVAAAHREALTPLQLDAIWTVQHLTLHCVYRHADATCQPRAVATAPFVRMRFHRCARARAPVCAPQSRRFATAPAASVHSSYQ